MNFPMPTLRVTVRGLALEDVPLTAIAAAYDTPCYVYSRAAIESAFDRYRTALPPERAEICYAVKANGNLSILRLLAARGAGFDIVSRGELERVLAAGGEAHRIVFSGVAKGAAEIRRALEVGIGVFNVESAAELARITHIARELGRHAPVALRINPDVDPKTHPYISTGLKRNKFGIPVAEALELYRQAKSAPEIELVGIACHIGSQLLDPSPLLEAADRVKDVIARLERDGIRLRHIDLGGGLGIRYRDETPPDIPAVLRTLADRFADRPERLVFEPGRSVVGNAGLLLTRVEYLKQGEEQDFALVDAGMNDLMRPALYDAWHEIVPVVPRPGPARRYDVVGPVCESSDFLGRGRELALAPGDLLAVLSAGAYGMAMSSNYNARPRPAEVLVDGATHRLIRRRESLESLWAPEET
ncbi:diaminopimelate decarboxylase [Tepidiphilus baoligensis]|uniref:Diaminopimelate decarboxylase n=1 Tax=Tepidiphilus baoligensis TaxID=2698687 RepID=A0ABX1QKY3_9PROT|nr:diaminopimelate decarboxylase [Tepidiphilus baoligensis]NMH15730.1 diaminopimelate decarboxylase [Tepidiphilus baoligensis]